MTNATNDQAMIALRKMIADNGLTYADLAELACVSIKTVESWLATPGAANHRNFHRRHLNSIAFGLPAFLKKRRAAQKGKTK